MYNWFTLLYSGNNTKFKINYTLLKISLKILLFRSLLFSSSHSCRNSYSSINTFRHSGCASLIESFFFFNFYLFIFLKIIIFFICSGFCHTTWAELGLSQMHLEGGEVSAKVQNSRAWDGGAWWSHVLVQERGWGQRGLTSCLGGELVCISVLGML